MTYLVEECKVDYNVEPNVGLLAVTYTAQLYRENRIYDS